MNVTFKMGEELGNGFKIVGKNGLTQFVAENSDVCIVFESDAGEGRNYSKIKSYYDKDTKRSYQAQRYLIKYVSTVQGFSNELYKRWKKENWEQCVCGHVDCMEHKTGVYANI